MPFEHDAFDAEINARALRAAGYPKEAFVWDDAECMVTHYRYDSPGQITVLSQRSYDADDYQMRHLSRDQEFQKFVDTIEGDEARIERARRIATVLGALLMAALCVYTYLVLK